MLLIRSNLRPAVDFEKLFVDTGELFDFLSAHAHILLDSEQPGDFLRFRAVDVLPDV